MMLIISLIKNIIKKEHDISLANKIMKTISGEFEDKVSVSIKFA